MGIMKGIKNKRGRGHINTPEDFWDRVAIKLPQECWEWTGCILEDGYGQTRMNMQKHRTHRLAYQLTYGLIPDGLQVLHTCDNTKCCNPNHLWIGTTQDNTQDKITKGRARYLQGEELPQTKLTRVQAEEIKRLLSNKKYTEGQLSIMFNISRGAISGIRIGRNWK